MTTYAIGDIQGCYDGLHRLLDRIRFDPAADRLWLVGDLVNRGGQSLEVLRLVHGLRDHVVAVLGNHDLALLAHAVGVGKQRNNAEFERIVQADDGGTLLSWLSRRSLLHVDRTLGWAMVHAGIYPGWDLATAQALATEVAEALCAGELGVLLDGYEGPWRKTLQGSRRLSFITATLTRMRFVCDTGALKAGASGPPGSQSPGSSPWFAWPGRAELDLPVVCGHWASLGLHRQPDVMAIDTGYVWGGSLTAVALETPDRIVQVSNPGGRSDSSRIADVN